MDQAGVQVLKSGIDGVVNHPDFVKPQGGDASKKSACNRPASCIDFDIDRSACKILCHLLDNAVSDENVVSVYRRATFKKGCISNQYGFR